MLPITPDLCLGQFFYNLTDLYLGSTVICNRKFVLKFTKYVL